MLLCPDMGIQQQTRSSDADNLEKILGVRTRANFRISALVWGSLMSNLCLLLQIGSIHAIISTGPLSGPVFMKQLDMQTPAGRSGLVSSRILHEYDAHLPAHP